MVALNDIVPVHRLLDAARFLVHRRLAQAHLATLNLNYQVALGIRLKLARAVHREPDSSRVGAGRDHEVMLQLPLVPVVDQVNARINATRSNFPVIGNVGVPLCGLVADKVVGLARQLLEPCHPGRSIRAHEFQPERVCGQLSVVCCFLQRTTDT